MMCEVLVTGGAGFVGSHVVDRLVVEGCRVSILDNLSAGRFDNVAQHVKDGRVGFFQGDVQDRELVRRLVKKVDAVIHLAAVTSVPFSVENSFLTNRVNVEGTLNLLEACLDSAVQKFLFVSSCAVYGEASYVPIDENHPTLPQSPYASSKLAAEHYCRAFNELHAFKTVVLRPFNVYGPRQRRKDGYNNVITCFAENLSVHKPLVVYGDGSQTRDFIHVYDVAEAIWLAYSVESAEGQVFNVGSGRQVEINRLARMLLECASVQTEISYEEPRAGDLNHSQADVTRAKEVLHFEPRIPLEDGLRSILSRYESE